MKTKAVIYARVSTDLQQTKNQIEDLQKYAKENNFDVVEVFDETVSGFSETKEKLSNLKIFIKEHNIKQILCYELSRIGRNARQTLNEIDYFTKEGVNIYIKKDNLNSINGSTTNKFLLNILSVIADFEVATFKDRSARGRISAIMQGKTTGLADLPYGYKKDEKTKLLAIDEDDSKIVKQIFDMAIKGISLYGICTQLNSLNVQTKRNAKWHPKVVRTILKKTIYKGVRLYKGQVVSVPAIISVEDWDKVQERFDNHIGYINHSVHPYLLKGKIRCGVCNRTYCTVTKKSGYSFYFCTGTPKHRGQCKNDRFISTKLLDKYVFVSLFNHPNIDEAVLSDELKKSKKEQIKLQIEFYKSEIEKNEAKRKRLANAYTNGDYTDKEYNQLRTTIKNTIVDLNNKISVSEKELTFESSINLSELLTKIYQSSDENLKRDFVVKYIDKIVIHDIEKSNIKWDKKLHNDDRLIYAKVYAFNDSEPIHLVMTNQTGQANIYTIKNKVNLNAAGDTLTVK